MSKIKIISNPYNKETRFKKWNDEENEWVDINNDNNKNSKLLKSEFTGGFFPFKAKKIVDCILEEYGTEEEKLEIDFEGADDEFDEIEAVIHLDTYEDKIVLVRSEMILENARDILPEVCNLFQEMSPLILQSVKQEKIQRDLGRFTDASSDVVPIRVLGNYSAGKSTFINALIGCEILPSGTEPVTAKVYKISRSKYPDRAVIRCKYMGYDINVIFTENETKFEEGMLSNAFTVKLSDMLSQMEGESISYRVNKALIFVNDYESELESPAISDLIEVDIPFVNGVLAMSQHPFVIFDTPGSNSASNARHLMVLKEAMENMTNGLPIFLSTPDSLDSMDNENLYHIIRDMKELDNRFTMIVVNKADSAGIQRRGSELVEEKRILSQAVPRNLYSAGLFYVSSIIGLGAKIDGEFEDYIYEDIYDAQASRYKNPDHKHYRTLYQFNIQPEQLKQKAYTLAAAQENLIYANSGLFTIESEIEVFAGKYSAYNKCFQSQMFLRNVIQITEEEIIDKTQECTAIRQSIKDKLESDKKQLIERLEEKADSERQIFVEGYPTYMKEFVDGTKEIFSAEELKIQEEHFIEGNKEILGYEGTSEDFNKSKDNISENLKSNVSTASAALKELKFDSIKQALGSTVINLKEDVSTAYKKKQLQNQTKHQANRQASDDLLRYVADKYEEKLAEINELLDSKSKDYWTEKTENLRDSLAIIVSGSEVLTEECRIELKHIIINYRQISFGDKSADDIFNKVKFERKVKLGEQVLWKSDHLKIDKLANTYNENISHSANELYETIEDSHQKSALEWIQSLLDEIYENIVEYSPELSNQAKQIRIMTEHIEELEGRQLRLQQYTEQLIAMMDWKLIS